MGLLLIMEDGPIAILFVIGFFALVFLLAKMSKFKPKYRQRSDVIKEEKIKKLREELQNLEKKK